MAKVLFQIGLFTVTYQYNPGNLYAALNWPLLFSPKAISFHPGGTADNWPSGLRAEAQTVNQQQQQQQWRTSWVLVRNANAPSHPDSGILGVGSGICFNKSFRWFSCTSELEKHISSPALCLNFIVRGSNPITVSKDIILAQYTVKPQFLTISHLE